MTDSNLIRCAQSRIKHKRHLQHEILEDRYLLAGDLQFVSAPDMLVAGGAQLDLPVSYQTLDNTMTPVDILASGLGLRLHYDSTKLTFDSLTLHVTEDVFGTTSVPVEDALDYDGDADTDKYVLVVWNETPITDGWPFTALPLPATLYTATFTAVASDTTTDVNFTASSTGTIVSVGHPSYGESFGFLGDPATVTVDATAPRVVDVVLGGSWAGSFIDAVDGGGVGGGNGLGYSPVGSHQLDTVPWNGAGTIYVVFSEDVSASITSGNVVLTGTNGGTYSLGSFAYGVAGPNIVAIPVTGGISIDSLVLSINALVVEDAAGNALDGDWTTGQSGPSGSGSPGGQFDFFFNVLPGDANNDQQVTVSDAFDIFAWNTFATTEANARYDANGDGGITVSDAFEAFANNTFGLPSPPTPPSFAPVPPGRLSSAGGEATIDAVMMRFAVADDDDHPHRRVSAAARSRMIQFE